MLRRTKDQLQKTTKFNLPQKTFHTIKVELFKEEKEAYEKVLHFSRFVSPLSSKFLINLFYFYVLVHCFQHISMKKLTKKMLSNVVFQLNTRLNI